MSYGNHKHLYPKGRVYINIYISREGNREIRVINGYHEHLYPRGKVNINVYISREGNRELRIVLW